MKCKFCGKSYKARKNDLKTHLKKKKHQENVEKYREMQEFMKNCNTLFLKTARAELIWAHFLVMNNLSFNLSHTANSIHLLKSMFTDSEIASQIVTNRDKMEKLVSKVLAPALQSARKQHLQKLYSLSIDFSREISNKNNFLILVTYFQNETCSINREVYKVIEHNFTKGLETFNVLRKTLQDDRVEVKNMIALSIDNASDMSSSEKGVSGYFQKIDNGIFIKRCENHNLALPITHILKRPKKNCDINEYLRFTGQDPKLEDEIKDPDPLSDDSESEDELDLSIEDDDYIMNDEIYIEYSYDIPNFLKRTAKYFHFSYKREAEYNNYVEEFLKKKEVDKSEFYQEKEGYLKTLPKLNSFAQTRWCYISDALKDLIKNWEPLSNYWSNKVANSKNLQLKNSEIKGLLNFMSKEPFKFFVRLLLWISDSINKESLNYQHEKSKIHVIYENSLGLLRKFSAPILTLNMKKLT